MTARVMDIESLTARQAAVYAEAHDVSMAEFVRTGNSYVNATQVRHLRGNQTREVVRALTVDQVERTLCGMAQGGLLASRGRGRPQFMPKIIKVAD